MDTPNKQVIIDLLQAWINQRPGLDPRDYGEMSYPRDRSAYTSESRRITRQLHDARVLLGFVDNSNITAPALMDAFRAYSGRLQIKQEGQEYRLEYCTGQYWPTEYRAAACAVLASALWDYHLEDAVKEAESKNISTGDAIRAKFRRMMGAPMQKRWFD